MDTDQMINKLASKLGDEELGLLAHVMEKVAANAAQAAAYNVLTRDQQLDKLASDLASSGFSMEEIQGEIHKMAEERAVADECEKIASDCVAMGNIIGNTASEVFLGNIRGFIDKHASDEEDEEEELPPELQASEKKKKEDDEESEKEATDRRSALRNVLLQAARL
jgi:hypothetical protein